MQNLKIFPNLFSLVFSSFLKCILKSEHFQTKDEPHSWYNSKITDSEKRG